ncbi:MAG: hypothetical protein D6784_10785 [Chloroflexi bacterium]|nr:MAG: hypothetical protein D6784_10785 [Chloroflexota bacterium]
MAVVYPDIIGEYIDRPVRYAVDGIQYVGYFEPDTIAPEQVSHLILFLQNMTNAPGTVHIRLVLPHSGGFFKKGPPLLRVQQRLVQVKLAPAEAGVLTIPVTTTPQVTAGEHPVTVEMKVIRAKGRAERVRPPQAQSQLKSGFLDSLVGLNLVATLGATYTEKSAKKADFPLKIAGDPNPPERAPKMEPNYQTIWKEEDYQSLVKAVREIQEREVKFQEELTLEGLYATLYAESTTRFADAGLPLRIGEAIVMGKILTYCAQYFLSNPQRRRGLLVPIWELALAEEMDTTDVLQVIRTAGYYHLVKLAVALSFGLVAKAIKQQPWSLVERQTLAGYIAECLETGQNLEVDFLYLPLLTAGAFISNKLKLKGETPAHTLALLQKAYEARVDLFADAEMETADRIFRQILNAALKQAGATS